MRPLRLRVEGFTAFKSPSEVNFEGLDLMAFTGPNGAGKSSLLEAFLLALFGDCPRLKGRNFRDFISHGKPEFCVALEFSSGGSVYRVQRRYYRKKSQPQVRLEMKHNESWRVLTDKVSETDKAILGLLKIGYETFTRAVVLPQNLFDSFLKGDRDSRREVLGEILSLDLYEKAAALAGEKSRLLRERVKQDESAVFEIRSEISEEGFEAHRLLLRDHEEEISRLLETRGSLETRRVEVAKWLGILRELEALKKEEIEIRAVEAHWASREEELRRIKKLLPFLPNLAALAEKEKNFKSLQRDLQSTRTALETANADLKGAREAFLEAEALFSKNEPELRRKSEAFSLLAEMSARRERLEQDRSAKQAGLAELEKSLNGKEESRGKMEASAAKTEEDLKAISNSQIEWREKESRLAIFNDHLDELKSLSDLEKEIENRGVFSQARKKEIQETSRRLEECRKALAKTALLHSTAEKNHEAARMGLAVRDLRDRLVLGEGCPVCGQAVKILPEAHPSMPEPENLSALKSRHHLLLSEEGKLAQAETSLLHEAADAGRELEEAINRKKSLESTLSGVIGYPREEVLAKGREEYAQLKGVQKTLSEMRDRQANLSQKLEQARRQWLFQTEEMTRLQGEKKGLESVLSALSEEIRRISDEGAKAGLPAFSQELIGDELAGIEKERLSLASQKEKAAQCFHGLEGQTKQLNESLRRIGDQEMKLSLEVGDERARIGEKLSALGYGDFRNIPRIDPETLGEEEKELEAHRARKSGAAEKRRAHERELAQINVNPDGLEETSKRLEEELSLTDQRLNFLRPETGRIQALLAQWDASLSKAARINERLISARDEEARYAAIHLDLQKNKLPDFLLSHVLSRLLGMAAEKFREFSQGRYSLALEGTGDIQVLDSWNADEARPVSSLSGGESFAASLAMALALSEYLQGEQRVECLFIDEGFGSLDRETRDQAAEILAGLQTKSRLIGIVTHIEELAELFPHRVQVEKLPEGSFVIQKNSMEEPPAAFLNLSDISRREPEVRIGT